MRNLSHHTLQILLAFIVLVPAWLLSACTTMDDAGSIEPVTRESPTAETVDPTAPPTPSPSGAIEQVELLIPKESYKIGEPVPVTITNHLDEDVFYVAAFLRIEGAKRIPLLETILEEVVPPQKLSAGDSTSGIWDQIAWWAPEKEGNERFTTFSDERQVPPGQYQMAVEYAFTEEAINQDPNIVYSQVFTIE